MKTKALFHSLARESLSDGGGVSGLRKKYLGGTGGQKNKEKSTNHSCFGLDSIAFVGLWKRIMTPYASTRELVNRRAEAITQPTRSTGTSSAPKRGGFRLRLFDAPCLVPRRLREGVGSG